MIKKLSLAKFQIYSTIFSCILGSILHFTYDWTQNNIVALFSAVNESTWEHLKIAFFPMFITTIIGYYIYKNKYSNFICGKTLGIISTISFITIFFYTYIGIIGRNYDFINILSFYVGIALGEFITYKFIIENKKCTPKISFFIIGLLAIFFITFTYRPPQIGIFQDPLTGLYGLEK